MIRLFFSEKLPIQVERGITTKKENIIEGGIRMKKALCTIALMLLVATSAYAQATFSLTGSYWGEGKYWFNYNADARSDTGTELYNEDSFSWYEQDINLFPKITVGNTSLNMRVAITDTYWGAATSDSDTDDIGHGIGSADDNIAIERAFITHKFNDMFTLDVGLMDGTEWGTTFGNDKAGRWRVKLTTRTPFGVVGGLFEKIADFGARDYAADEGDEPFANYSVLAPALAGAGLDLTNLNWDYNESMDWDNYGLFAVTKVGSIYVKPLIFYVDINNVKAIQLNNNSDDLLAALDALSEAPSLETITAAQGVIDRITIDDVTRLNLVLAFDGELGPVSFESEINYNMFDVEYLDPASTAEDSWNTLGIYFNVWKALDAMTPGLVLAYGSYDEDAPDVPSLVGTKGFDFEDDFNQLVILEDEYEWGGGDGLTGMSLIKLYVNDIKTGIDSLTLSAYAGYVISNHEGNDVDGDGVLTGAEVNKLEDATAWEFGIGATYRITDNLYYMPYVSYASIDYDVTNVDDPDAVYLIANGIEFTF